MIEAGYRDILLVMASLVIEELTHLYGSTAAIITKNALGRNPCTKLSSGDDGQSGYKRPKTHVCVEVGFCYYRTNIKLVSRSLNVACRSTRIDHSEY